MQRCEEHIDQILARKAWLQREVEEYESILSRSVHDAHKREAQLNLKALSVLMTECEVNIVMWEASYATKH